MYANIQNFLLSKQLFSNFSLNYALLSHDPHKNWHLCNTFMIRINYEQEKRVKYL